MMPILCSTVVKLSEGEGCLEQNMQLWDGLSLTKIYKQKKNLLHWRFGTINKLEQKTCTWGAPNFTYHFKVCVLCSVHYANGLILLITHLLRYFSSIVLFKINTYSECLNFFNYRLSDSNNKYNLIETSFSKQGVHDLIIWQMPAIHWPTCHQIFRQVLEPLW